MLPMLLQRQHEAMYEEMLAGTCSSAAQQVRAGHGGNINHSHRPFHCHVLRSAPAGSHILLLQLKPAVTIFTICASLSLTSLVAHLQDRGDRVKVLDIQVKSQHIRLQA